MTYILVREPITLVGFTSKMLPVRMMLHWPTDGVSIPKLVDKLEKNQLFLAHSLNLVDFPLVTGRL